MSTLYALGVFIFAFPTVSAVIGALILGLIIFAIVQNDSKKRARRAEIEKLTQQYREQAAAKALLINQRYEPEIAERILKHQIWQGMTAEQLMDSVGIAEAVDTVVMKTKRKEIWKYYQETATRFGMRVTLEDGIVVGWQQR